jgi:hypothetical protein
MKERDRLNKLEEIGFIVVIMLTSIMIGFSILALIARIMRF